MKIWICIFLIQSRTLGDTHGHPQPGAILVHMAQALVRGYPAFWAVSSDQVLQEASTNTAVLILACGSCMFTPPVSWSHSSYICCSHPLQEQSDIFLQYPYLQWARSQLMWYKLKTLNFTSSRAYSRPAHWGYCRFGDHAIESFNFKIVF